MIFVKNGEQIHLIFFLIKSSIIWLNFLDSGIECAIL